jgi:hypothetical protein
MKRYTVQFRVKSKGLDAEVIGKAIERAFQDARYLISVNAILESEGSTLLVELRSEAAKGTITSLLKNLEPQLPIQLLQVTWGWLIPGHAPDTTWAITDGDTDAYVSAFAQTADEREYIYGVGMILITILSFSGTLLSIFFLILGLISSTHTLSFFSLLYGLGFTYVSFFRVFSIRCTQEGVEVRYWFRPRKRFEWQQVVGLEIFRALGEQWCLIQERGTRTRFPINKAYGLAERSTMIKTIVERSSLQFVAGTLWEKAIYKRFDAP